MSTAAYSGGAYAYFVNEDDSGVNYLNGNFDYYYYSKFDNGETISVETEEAKFPLTMELSPTICISFELDN